MSTTALQRDIADIARKLIQGMHRDGDRLDAEEIHQAVMATFKNHQLDANTVSRLRVYIERWIAKVTQR